MKKPLSLRLLYLFSKISYWGLIAITMIVLLVGITTLTQDSQLMKLGFNSNITYVKEVVYLNSENSTPIDVEFSAGSVGVPVKYLDRPTIAFVFIMLLMWLGCLTFITRYFKKFMSRVLSGLIFQTESITLLKKAAIGLVILEGIDWGIYLMGHFYVQRNFDLAGSEQKLDVSLFPSTALILALALWVLAYIFQKGREIEDEQKLTV